MKKFTMLAASIALAAASVVPAFAQVPTTGTATTSKVTAGHVKTMPAKAKASINATVKKHAVAKKHVTGKKASKKAHKEGASPAATSTIR